MRRKLLPLLLAGLFTGFAATAQTIPFGYCGIQYTYDASGNTLSKQYICANARISVPSSATVEQYAQNSAVQKVDILYTQPQSGALSLLFLKPLKGNKASITDDKSKELQAYILTGTNIEFNLSALPKGRYYLNLLDGDIRISQQIVKL